MIQKAVNHREINQLEDMFQQTVYMQLNVFRLGLSTCIGIVREGCSVPSHTNTIIDLQFLNSIPVFRPHSEVETTATVF